MAVFSLASLLRVRRLREERASWEMSRARSRASELAQDRHQLLDQLTDHGHDGTGVRGIAAISAARASTSTMLADLEALAITQQRILEDAEERHAAARRDVRTVEKLEEKHTEQTRRESIRAEQAVLDELAGRVRARLVPPGSVDA
jgi:flagellar FliJ protein